MNTRIGSAFSPTAAEVIYDSRYLQALNNLSDLNSIITARSNLGLGTIATQNSNNVTITGGSITNITDLAVADGGTGASTAANARTNLGLTAGGAGDIWVEKAGDTMSGDLNVPDEVYGSGWDASTEVPTKNAIYDKLETVISVTTLTLYVDKTNGTDAVGKGLSSGTGATKTIQYAFNLIPAVLGGNVVINITGEAYTEAPVLQGKVFSGAYTITIQGVKSTIETLTIGSGSAQGAFIFTDSHLYSTIVRSTGTWTTNQRANKWARVVETGDVRLIDSNTTDTLTLTGYPLTSAPTNGQTLVVEEPLTSITNLQIGTDQKGVIINDIIFAHATGTNQNLFGKYIDVEIYRCSFPYVAASNLWTNKDNNVLITDCFMTFMRLFCRNGSKVFMMGGKMFRPGGASRCIHIDEGATVYFGDGVVLDGNNDASAVGILLGGVGIMNFNGNTPGQAASRQFGTIRKFVTGVVNNTVSAPVNVGWNFVLFGTDIMPNAQERPTSLVTNKLVDTSVNFTTIGVAIGDKVQNLITNNYALVTAVDSATQLSLDDDIFTATTQSYRIVIAASLNTTADVNIALDAASSVQYQNGIKNAAPSKLHIAGSFGRFYRAITAARTLTVDDGTVNATSGTYAVTLPTAIGIGGREHYIVNSGTGVITLNTTSSQTIGGVASGIITLRQNESIGVFSNGANWLIFKQPYAVAVGASVSLGRVGGVIFDHYADVGNVGTGEDDLYSDTTAASTLGTNGDKITATYQGIFVGAAASTQDLRVYFAGTKIYDSGALAIGVATNSWTAQVTIIRESSTVVRCSVAISTDFATLFPYSAYTRITGLTLTNTQILKLTGEAAGVGAADSQIVAKLGTILFQPAA